jgi:flagellar basal-body rod modification protein FlgD
MSAISAVNTTADTTTSTAAKTTKPDLVSQDNFLQLLVAQIKNQDPLNPADGTQFLSQLAQFSSLEQLVGIRSELRAAQSTSTTGTTETNG